MFELHRQLEKDTTLLLDLPLCQLRILPDSQCEWVVLVPKRTDNQGEAIQEIHQLSHEDQMTLMEEITDLTAKMEANFQPDKINIGALGNLVPQLHIHLICRYRTDRAWPGPIWGIADEGEPEESRERKRAVVQRKIHTTLASYPR